MDIPASSDEGEPSVKPTRYLVFSLALFLFFSCKNEPDEQRTASLVKNDPDTLIMFPAKKPKPVKPKVRPAQPPPVEEEQTPQKKRIYLTFDDGPNKGTQNVLDIINQENIPANFFIVGQHVFDSPGQRRTWDSLKASTHIELYNHSYTHANNRYDHFYQLPETVVKDMEMTKEKLLPATNVVRAPGRNSWRIDSLHFTDIKKSKPAMDSLQKAGFIVLGWDLEWHYDPKTFQVKNTADELLSQIDSLFKKGRTKMPGNLVILAHDQVYHSAADSLQLREFIQKLKARDDYELSLVSAYPAIKKLLRTDSLAAKKPQTVDSLKKEKGDSL